MKNAFIKYLPALLIFVAIGLLFIPKTISYLDVEKFFSSTDAYYQRAENSIFSKDRARREDYYYPGVRIGKLWRKLGIEKAVLRKEVQDAPLRDEYLFGCGYANFASCVLPYPAIKEYSWGAYRALRVSSASLRFPDYQYLLFKEHDGDWRYFGHIDVFDNKKEEPVFRWLNNGLASVISLAGAGSGYSTEFMQIYHLDGVSSRLVMAVPSDASRRGLGLLDFKVTSAFDYTQGVLTGNYQVSFFVQEGGVDPGYGKITRLFTAKRRLTLRWDGHNFIYDAKFSDITPAELVKIVSGSYARVYALFRAEFDQLYKAGGIKRKWLKEFLSVVMQQGVDVSAPLPGSLQTSKAK